MHRPEDDGEVCSPGTIIKKDLVDIKLLTSQKEKCHYEHTRKMRHFEILGRTRAVHTTFFEGEWKEPAGSSGGRILYF